MFSQELENLILATLEDGVIEDYEKAALVKRAQDEGVDLTELEIYINSILQKRQREKENEKNAQTKKKAQEKKEAFGRVCPSCGKQVSPLTLKCECGYEFVTSRSVSSVKLLSDKIESILNRDLKGDDSFMEFEYMKSFKEQQREIITTIQMFSVPNTKEDIIEFLALSLPNSKKKVGFMNSRLGRALPATIFGIITLPVLWGAMILVNTWGKIDKDPVIAHNTLADVWRTKFEQVLLKGRGLHGDSEFQRQLDYYESMINKES